MFFMFQPYHIFSFVPCELIFQPGYNYSTASIVHQRHKYFGFRCQLWIWLQASEKFQEWQRIRRKFVCSSMVKFTIFKWSFCWKVSGRHYPCHLLSCYSSISDLAYLAASRPAWENVENPVFFRKIGSKDFYGSNFGQIRVAMH